jgi:hypothetical protein
MAGESPTARHFQLIIRLTFGQKYGKTRLSWLGLFQAASESGVGGETRKGLHPPSWGPLEIRWHPACPDRSGGKRKPAIASFCLLDFR